MDFERACLLLMSPVWIWEILYASSVWGLPLAISQQDVRTAFDSMGHHLICETLLSRGVKPLNVGLHIRELTGMQAFIELPHVGKTDLFDFSRGGKQGGIETPDEWRAVLDYLLDDLVAKWQIERLGFLFPGDSEDSNSELIVSHAIWADNVVLFARDVPMLQQMISDLDAAIAAFRHSKGNRYLAWKAGSFEFMVGASCQDNSIAPPSIHKEGQQLNFTQKRHF